MQDASDFIGAIQSEDVFAERSTVRSAPVRLCLRVRILDLSFD
jgi:hypothetical protein